MAPLQEKIKIIEENEDKVNGEMIALKADNLRWRARVTGLIEKHQKISPEEMKKVQVENSKLNQRLSLLNNQLKGTQSNLSMMTTKSKTLDDKLIAKHDDLHKTLQVIDQNSVTYLG
jgi:hypothetical protein